MRGAALFILVTSQLAAAAPRAVAEPPAMVLGEDRFALIRVMGGSPKPMYAACSAGELSEQKAEGTTRVFRWTPPDVRYPGVAVLLFWQPRPEGPEAAVLTIPLTGRTTLEMDTEPRASVQVQLGTAVFGPALADERGRVVLPILVAPGVNEALVTATAHGRQTTRTVRLEAPAARPWVAALPPEPLPAEGGWLLVAHDGQLASRAIQVRATGASARQTAGGSNYVVFRVAPDPGRGEPVALEISAAGYEARHLKAQVARSAPLASAQADSGRLGWLWLNALGGGFAAGGANKGPAFELAASYRLPGKMRALAAELVVGVRSAGLRRDVADLGRVESTLLAVPVNAALRFRTLELGRWAMDLRTGVGIAPFRHAVSSALHAASTENGVGFDAFGAAQGRYRIGRWALALEVRGAYTTARTSRLTAQPGGVLALAGIGWALP